MRKSLKIIFGFFLLIMAGGAYVPKTTFAAIIDGSYPDCPTTCSTSSPGTCAKSEPGNCPSCGATSDDCCSSIGAWEKYKARCKLIDPYACNWVWVYDTQICSTADKCISGETGLRAGSCDCGYGGIYKTCCSGSTPVACRAYGIQDGTYPDEGVCPSGADTVFCGFGDHPACGAAACQVIPTLPPGTPTPTPTGDRCWCYESCDKNCNVNCKWQSAQPEGYAPCDTSCCQGGGGIECQPSNCGLTCWSRCDYVECPCGEGCPCTVEDRGSYGGFGLRYLGVLGGPPLSGSQGWYNCGTITRKVGESVTFGVNWWKDFWGYAGLDNEAYYYVRKEGDSWPSAPTGSGSAPPNTDNLFTYTFNTPGKYDVMFILKRNWFCWSSNPHFCAWGSCSDQGLVPPMNTTNDIARVFTVDVQATPPKCEFINPPSQVEVGKSYTIKVKATSQEPTMNIRKVTISRAQTNNFDATTGWREIKNITCNGQTCEGEGVWNVTSDDLTFEGNKWWLACNAYYYNEDENGTNSTRCTGNPWSVSADWADCWPPYSGDREGIDADAYDDKDSQEVTVCQNIAPGAPTNPSPANDVDLNTLPSSLSWRAPNSWGVCCPGHNNHYLVYLDDNSDFSSPVINGASTTATSYSLSGKVEAGKTYYWKVVAHNGCLTTPTPHTVWSFCINKAPNAASGLIPQGQSYPDNRNITLSWGNLADDKWGLNCAGNTNRYFVYYCKKGDPNCSSDSVPNDNNKRCTPEEGVGDNNTTPIFSCTIPGPLSWESTYYWKVVTSNGALTNEAFGSFEITYPSAWWQTKTGDVYGSEIFSPIWREVPEAQRYFSLVGPFGSQSGLVAAPNCLGSSGARCNFGAAQATQTEFPASGRGGINANFTPLLNDYSYDQLAHLVDLAIKDDKQGSYNSGVKVIKSDKINKTDLVGASAGLYYYPPYGTGDMAVSLNDDNFSIGASEKLIIFVEDDLNINRNITVASGGFLAFVVKGNINIASNVTQVQGVYFANGSLTVESNGAIDSQFNGQGIFVGKNGVSLERNFRSVANTTTPTEIFTFDPAYLFTAPKVFREKPYLWQEVIP